MRKKKISLALTIAGSDSGGGAGIQADLKTFFAFGVYGTSVITSLTAQNTCGVSGIFEVEPSFVLKQIRAVFDDMRVDAVKTGMLYNKKIVGLIASYFKNAGFKKIIVDPVMISKSGHRLLKADAVKALKEKLLPIAFLVTPNIFEAEKLTGMKICSVEDMKKAGKLIQKCGVRNVLIKGGHLSGNPCDVLVSPKGVKVYEGKRYSSGCTHGVGCTLSSAITASVARGFSIFKAVEIAKRYVEEAIKNGYNPGKGCGPVNHFVKPKIE